jgi:hypothetical protein
MFPEASANMEGHVIEETFAKNPFKGYPPRGIGAHL